MILFVWLREKRGCECRCASLQCTQDRVLLATPKVTFHTSWASKMYPYWLTLITSVAFFFLTSQTCAKSSSYHVSLMEVIYYRCCQIFVFTRSCYSKLIYISIFLSFYLSIYLYLSFCLFLHLSICTCLTIYLSTYLCISVLMLNVKIVNL